MAELSARKRAKVPKQEFGLPERAKSSGDKKESGNYPMPDRRHAANAKARAKQQLKKGNLSRPQYDKIVARADRVLSKSAKKKG
jgi:hypothetical protein